MDKTKLKAVFSTGMLVLTAIGAFADVLAKDKKEKEFQEMKKALAELQKKED